MMICDIAIITDIYPAREKPITGITGKLVYDVMKDLGHKNSHYISDLSNLNEVIENNAKKGDMLITMGAGTIWRYGESILKYLSQKNEKQYQ